MKLLLDMNLSPQLQIMLEEAGFEALHWSRVGNWSAPDTEILHWARQNGFIILTHDLDFGTLLFFEKASSPSVLQIRAKNIDPERLKEILVVTLNKYAEMLEHGALITLYADKSKVVVLPIR
jgi:predicted nuclease of predicted toxin-antitoxin system